MTDRGERSEDGAEAEGTAREETEAEVLLRREDEMTGADIAKHYRPGTKFRAPSGAEYSVEELAEVLRPRDRPAQP